MKVALLVDSLGFGGAQRQIINLAIELKKEGKEIFFLRYRENDFYFDLLQGEGITPLLIRGNSPVVRELKLRKTLTGISPDVVISFMDAPSFYASLASFGKKWVLITSERVAKEDSFLSNKMKLIKKVQAKKSNYIVCNSYAAEKIWSKFEPVTRVKLRTIYNIINVPKCKISSSNDEKCRVIVAARYEKVKNIQGMIEAVDKLTNDDKNRLEIHWYGKENVALNDESELTKARALLFEKNLENCIFLHPATSDIYSIMAQADYVGLFSFAEGLPNAIIEGMFLHKPIIMSTVSDYEVLVNGDNGFTYNPNDIDEISNVLHKIINQSKEERASMGECSYKKIQKICSKEKVMKEWNALLRIGEKYE